MKFAPVLPPLLGSTDKGDYHMVQAFSFSGYLDRSSEPWETYYHWGISNDHYLILDNGAYEVSEGLGDSAAGFLVGEEGPGEIDTTQLFQVAGEIWPDEIVCPDVVKDKDATLVLMTKHLPMCRKLAKSVMLVPQGKSLLEWTQCAANMLAYCKSMNPLPTIGVPKYLEEPGMGGRFAAVVWLENRETKAPIHLLGVRRYFSELTYLDKWFTSIRGADSTFPFAMALNDQLFGGGYGKKFPVPTLAWTGPYPDQVRLATEINIAVCRKMLEGSRGL